MTNWCARCEKKIDETGHVCFDKQPPIKKYSNGFTMWVDRDEAWKANLPTIRIIAKLHRKVKNNDKTR